MIIPQDGTLEYLFTAGILISVIALVCGIIKDRKGILHVLKESGLKKAHIAFLVGIIALFLFIELYFVHSTQLLFFDDAIYQSMALMLLHTGQAWMCNYGTPTACYQGQIFHEPIGLSFNIAIAYAIFGTGRAVAYGAELGLAVLSIIMGFLAALVLLKDAKAALFTALLLALTPVLLVWAKPTNSDMAVLAYSLVSVFFFIIFVRRKTLWSLSNMLFSLSLLMYMKVDEFLFVPLFVLFYFILERKSVSNSAKELLGYAKRGILDTKLLIILLFFVFAMVPSLLYSFHESVTDGYGWQGTTVQQTCTAGLTPMAVTGEINLANFKANICSNLLFWLNSYKSTYIMQPILFTALAILGALLMVLIGKKANEFAMLGIWFLVFFMLYAAFYAGSVTYGVDWRFMLSLVAQTCMLGGFALASLSELAASAFRKIGQAGRIAAIALAIIVMVPAAMMMPLLSVKPSAILQAGDARFYENFVYNNSRLIPNNCIVYTYDPTLYQLNGKTATQIDNIYNFAQVRQNITQYGCAVLDYGYWCHTPNNECTGVNQSYSLTPIDTAAYNTLGYSYGFYYIKPK